MISGFLLEVLKDTNLQMVQLQSFYFLAVQKASLMCVFMSDVFSILQNNQFKDID
jgi:hypothetical protein